MPPTKPPALKQGDTIGIMSPSSYVEKADIRSAEKVLRDHGYKVLIHPQTFARDRQSAGTSEQKVEALHALFANKDVKAIIAAGGGNRSLHILDELNFGLIKKNPKILMGFSDATALINAVHARTGLVTFHGPVAKRLSKISASDLAQAFDLLAGAKTSYAFGNAKTVRAGKAKGPLIGGNMAMLQSLIGGKDLPSLDGAILFLEDTGEETSRIDRTFCQFRRSGLFKKLSGLVLGEFSDRKDTGRPFGFTLEDIVRDHTRGLKYPVVMDAPFGHGARLCTFPVGTKAVLGNNALTLTEAAVR